MPKADNETVDRFRPREKPSSIGLGNMYKDEIPAMPLKDVIEKYQPLKVLKITVSGIDRNGEVEHNFPCPVCAQGLARYTMIAKKHVFAPCVECTAEGFVIAKRTNGMFGDKYETV